MTERLEQAVLEVRMLPPALQDEIASLMLRYLGKDSEVIQLTPEEHAELDEAEAEADRGEFASDEEVRAIWAKHGL